ncbi:B3 domain-containing protein REM9-like isoform X1 [Capsicum galapagoense]
MVVDPNNNHPSFSNLLQQGFMDKLRMPAAFVKEHKKMLAKTCLVKTDEGLSWEVKLVKETSHYFICEEGWSRFVMHHKLELGDMLIFFLVEKSTFYVLPYSKKSVTNVRHFEELSSSDEENTQIGPSRISKKVKTESIESLGGKSDTKAASMLDVRKKVLETKEAKKAAKDPEKPKMPARSIYIKGERQSARDPKN